MRKVYKREQKKNDCESCLDYLLGMCPFEECPYIARRHNKPRVYDSPVFAKTPTTAEVYNIKTIINLANSGMMAVEIAERMNMKPQIVADIINTTRGRNKNELLQDLSLVQFKSRPE